MLLSAESDTGSVEIGLHQGRPYVRYLIQNSAPQKLSSPVKVNDLNLHSIRVNRIGERMRLIVDSEMALDSKIRASKFDMNFAKIKIGQKWMNNENKLVGFRGCIYQGNGSFVSIKCQSKPVKKGSSKSNRTESQVQ